jgi:arylsulfatase A-like enzyme
MEKNRNDPFFLYLAYNAPHSPYQAPIRYVNRFVEQGMPVDLAATYAMVENLDDNVGRLMRNMDRLGLTDNTALIFLSDNGPAGTSRFNAGLRGAKGTVYEGGVRVPFFMRWPRGVQGGRKVDTIAAHIDIFPGPDVVYTPGAGRPAGCAVSWRGAHTAAQPGQRRRTL